MAVGLYFEICIEDWIIH